MYGNFAKCTNVTLFERGMCARIRARAQCRMTAISYSVYSACERAHFTVEVSCNQERRLSDSRGAFRRLGFLPCLTDHAADGLPAGPATPSRFRDRAAAGLLVTSRALRSATGKTSVDVGDVAAAAPRGVDRRRDARTVGGRACRGQRRAVHLHVGAAALVGARHRAAVPVAAVVV